MNKQIIEDYLKATVDSILRGGDTKFWPVGPGQTDIYFNDIFAVDLLEKFRDNPDKFKQALSTLSPNVLRWFTLPFVVLGLKLARNYEGFKVDPKEIVNIIKTVREVLVEKVSSEPFCLDNKNLILKDSQLEGILKASAWFEAQERKQINLLSVDLESFIWAIDFDLFAYGVFWHGPYSLPSGKTLLVKSFIDLDSPIWNLNVKYSQANFYFIFEGKVDVAIDFMSHMDYQGDIWSKLEKLSVDVDGKFINSLEEINKLDQYFSDLRDKQTKLINSLTPEDLILKSAEIYYFMFHPFFVYYQQSWQPPKEVVVRIKRDGLKYWKQFNEQPTLSFPSRTFFEKLYSPNNNFTD